MLSPYLALGRLQRKVLIVVLVIVVVPMLVAGWLASEWVSTSFEQRIEQWIVDAARGNQNWLQAYQNDAVMLGRVLADDAAYVTAVQDRPEESMPASVRRISQELGINLIQLYTPDRRLVYSSIPVEVSALWEPGQTEAVLKVVRRQKSMLAAVGITPIPRQGPPSFYLVLGSLLGQDFTDELAQLTGLKTRLYYRDGKNYYDVFSNPDDAVVLKHLSASALAHIDKDKKPYYSANAENGKFRGLYMPILDSSGHVEAIMFSGIEKRGFQEVLTNRIALFLLIALLGVVTGFTTGLILSRVVIRPLTYLRDGVMQLAGQNFHTTVPIQSDDELGDLAKAFNAMATRLREARDEQVQHFQKDKLAALGELSAALAHEIRNPLGVINTSSALLEKSASDPAKLAELTRMIREESVRVSSLVQDFLQLSRHRQPVFEIVDPTLPLERALGLAMAGREDIRVHRAFTHGATVIHADAGLLQQAWGNVCTNALQAMGPGGGELWLSTRAEAGFVYLTFEDSGPGVPAEIMPRLFEPFFTTKESGTGLGLSIAYMLVEANGGRLAALPPSGRGARFVMRFPVMERP